MGVNIEASDIMAYRFPRWQELPEISLYIDQVVFILQSRLAIFLKDKSIPVITTSMINNYVKQGAIAAPVKKRYNREHLAYLFVICVLKRLMSISEITESIAILRKLYSVEEGYNLFCTEMEAALKRTFSPHAPSVSAPELREIATLRAIAAAFAYSILVDRLILMRDK
ncbi:MAG: DUF1836 domain-containing protein [Clostridia bacterium]|nr:DUF1836 domain-containing protein [Clostridia bacterium]